MLKLCTLASLLCICGTRDVAAQQAEKLLAKIVVGTDAGKSTVAMVRGGRDVSLILEFHKRLKNIANKTFLIFTEVGIFDIVAPEIATGAYVKIGVWPRLTESQKYVHFIPFIGAARYSIMVEREVYDEYLGTRHTYHFSHADRKAFAVVLGARFQAGYALTNNLDLRVVVEGALGGEPMGRDDIRGTPGFGHFAFEVDNGSLPAFCLNPGLCVLYHFK